MIGVAKTIWCLVKLPNSVVLEVDVEPKADAQECLHKVLDQLSILETDYFGLQYQSPRDPAPTWLNLRNPLDRQLQGNGPHRLRLRVKFFVPPHRLLQQTTLEQFYQHVRQEVADAEVRLATEAEAVRLAACIAQAEYGDHARNTGLYQQLLPANLRDSSTLANQVAEEHRALAGISQSAARYKLLQAAADIQSYGMEFFQVHLETTAAYVIYGRDDCHKSQALHNVGVGPEGVTVYNAKWRKKKLYPYPRVHRITNYSRSFRLLIFNDDGSDFPIDFRLPSKSSANSIYRCMTEMYSFYLCETVRDNVVTQFSRDLKGTLASLFNENSSVGKKYTFDIQRTSQEAYDHYRRLLYKAGQSPTRSHDGVVMPTAPTAPSAPIPMDVYSDSECASSCESSCSSAKSTNESEAAMKQQLRQFQESVLCCVCVDQPLSVVFQPCSHVVCCAGCASRLESCPVCRTTIEQRQHVYMPSLPGTSQEQRLEQTVTLCGEACRL